MMNHLSQERWQQIDALFAEALDRPPDERSAFLRYSCGEDRRLYNEVLALLESELRAEDALGESAAEFAGFLLAELEADLEKDADDAPAQIGAYRILRELGRGGMGAVYLAVREGDGFEQRVALKLVKRGMDTDDILRRFRHERRILASLHHPNIARLVDGGVAEDGRPYLTMEYVEGIPIDRYCDLRKLTVEERLRLFEPVCTAVQYAHQNLVVHRDLKPTNVLVTEEGDGHPCIKLLDFGIAKLLEPEVPTSAPVTRTWLRIMTPAYASPEQLSGTPVTTASDVYTLGVILYRLLTGCLPHESHPGGTDGGAFQSFDRDPERPSAAVTRASRHLDDSRPTGAFAPDKVGSERSTTSERLSRRLRGDLDTIVLKALHRDPERRYASVEQLAEDVERHLSGRPVHARPDTMAYRSHKFIRRHVLGVSAAAAFAVLLVAFGFTMMMQLSATARARDTAEVERDKAERVVRVFTEMFESADPGEARGDTVTVVEVLSRSRDRIDSGLVDQPDVQGTMYNVLGKVYQSLGQYGPSQEMLEKALSVQREVLRAPHPDLIETMTDLAELSEKTARYDAAERYHLDALAMRRQLYGEGHPETFENLNLLASLLYRRGELDQAATRLDELLAANRKAFGSRHTATANVQNELGAVLKRMEQFDRAGPLLREAMETYHALLGDDHPRTLSTRANYASLLSENGDLDGAEALFRDLLDTRIRVLGVDHPDIALTLTGLGVTLHRRGAFGEAASSFRRALAINRQALGHDHPTVGMDLATLAGLLQEMNELEEAAPLYDAALAILRKAFPPGHPAIAYPLVNWGRMLVDQGAFEDALPMLREGFEIRTAGFGQTYWGTAQAQGALGACLAGLLRFEEAAPLLLESYGLLLEARGAGDKHSDSVRRHLFDLYKAWNRPDKASSYQPVAISP